MFAGGSSGAVFFAIQKYFENKKMESIPNVVFLCADKGEAYIDMIYNNPV